MNLLIVCGQLTGTIHHNPARTTAAPLVILVPSQGVVQAATTGSAAPQKVIVTHHQIAEMEIVIPERTAPIVHRTAWIQVKSAAQEQHMTPIPGSAA